MIQIKYLRDRPLHQYNTIYLPRSHDMLLSQGKVCTENHQRLSRALIDTRGVMATQGHSCGGAKKR